MIKDMTDGSAIPVQERRMLYRALERKMEEKETPQALIEKFKACQGSHKKRPQPQQITSFGDSAVPPFTNVSTMVFKPFDPGLSC